MLFKERQNGDAADQNLVMSIMDEISKISKRLNGLQSGTRIFSQMKTLLDEQSSSIINSSSHEEERKGKPDDSAIC